jgi:hypothetical protein
VVRNKDLMLEVGESARPRTYHLGGAAEGGTSDISFVVHFCRQVYFAKYTKKSE